MFNDIMPNESRRRKRNTIRIFYTHLPRVTPTSLPNDNVLGVCMDDVLGRYAKITSVAPAHDIAGGFHKSLQSHGKLVGNCPSAIRMRRFQPSNVKDVVCVWRIGIIR
jgi:hypothetical protein